MPPRNVTTEQAELYTCVESLAVKIGAGRPTFVREGDTLPASHPAVKQRPEHFAKASDGTPGVSAAKSTLHEAQRQQAQAQAIAQRTADPDDFREVVATEAINVPGRYSINVGDRVVASSPAAREYPAAFAPIEA